MSIQTELTRIVNAKAAIKTAIEGKGVTVPDGTLLDGMAALIESIEAGGGGGVVFAGGTYTPETTGFQKVNITHNLGIIPDIFAFYRYTSNLSVPDSYCMDMILMTTAPFVAQANLDENNRRRYIVGGVSRSSTSDTGFGELHENTIVLYNSQTKLVAGTIYSWFAVGGLTT